MSDSARRARYVPDRGDAVWLTFEPHSGHEQAGRRPAVVISPQRYNRVSGLALLCPITSRVKGYPFEVVLPADLPINGAVLSDQVRNIDWRARKVSRICALPPGTVEEILGKLQTLLSNDASGR